MSSHIRKFTSFREVKHKFDKYNESVIQIDDKYRVGGIEVSQSLINSYIKKIKDETGKNVRQMFSDMEIAEQLVKYVANNKLDVDKIPSAALLGGEIPMDDDDIIDDTTEATADETGIVNTDIPAEQPTTEEPTTGPSLEQPVSENPEETPEETPEEPIDNEELPTEFEEPNLDTEEETTQSDESDEETEENPEEKTDEEETKGNEDLPI